MVKKKVAKKTKPKSKKKIVKAKPTKVAVSKPIRAGEITHFFNNISVAVVKVFTPIKIGDKISIKGTQTDFKQTVKSMQINHKPIKEAKKGQDLGMKVNSPVRPNDQIYKI